MNKYGSTKLKLFASNLFFVWSKVTLELFYYKDCFLQQCLQSQLTYGSRVAFSLDTEQPDYDLDSDDEAFVDELKKKMDISYLQFEEMIDRLEKGSGQQVSAPKHDLTMKQFVKVLGIQ